MMRAGKLQYGSCRLRESWKSVCGFRSAFIHSDREAARLDSITVHHPSTGRHAGRLSDAEQRASAVC